MYYMLCKAFSLPLQISLFVLPFVKSVIIVCSLNAFRYRQSVLCKGKGLYRIIHIVIHSIQQLHNTLLNNGNYKWYKGYQFKNRKKFRVDFLLPKMSSMRKVCGKLQHFFPFTFQGTPAKAEHFLALKW